MSISLFVCLLLVCVCLFVGCVVCLFVCLFVCVSVVLFFDVVSMDTFRCLLRWVVVGGVKWTVGGRLADLFLILL